MRTNGMKERVMKRRWVAESKKQAWAKVVIDHSSVEQARREGERSVASAIGQRFCHV